MKLRTLALAVAAASLSVSAQAADVSSKDMDIKFGGDFHIGYKSDRDQHLEDFGTELWFDVSQKSGSLTYFAHAELEFRGGIYGDSDVSVDGVNTDIDDDITIDEVYVGVKGAFGTLRAGDIENACDKLEVGGDWNEFLAASDSRGDCGGDHEGTILYTKKMGKAEYGVSHNVDTAENSVAVRYKHSKALQLGLGYVQKKDDDDVTSASITYTQGKFGLKARVNDGESDDMEHSVFLAFMPTKLDNFNIGHDSDETISIGYNRKLSKSAKLFVEARERDGRDAETGIGVQYKF